jgi:elongation factor P
MIDTSDIRKNLKLLIDGDPWIVVDFQFVKPGKGQAFTRTKMKNLISGNVIERTYKSGEKLDEARIDESEMVFLYNQGKTYTFMDNTTYEQVELTEDHVGDAKNFLVENMNVEMLFFDERPISVEVPTS